MGLSSSPKEILATHQAIVEIAQCLKTIVSDPKVFETLAKQAYALPAAEQERAVAAKENIVKYVNLISEHEKTKKSLDDYAANNERVKASLDTRAKKITEKEQATQNMESETQEGWRALENARKEFAAKETKLNADNLELTKKTAALDVRKAKIDEFESELKERAKRFKTITEGL